MTKNIIDFTVNGQYQKYLKLVELPESAMNPVQRIETKRAFFGAWGQALIHMRDELGVLPENEAVVRLEEQIQEISKFWLKTRNRES